MEACSELLIPDILEYKNDLGAIWGDDKPLYIEIGCGKGKFITETAITVSGFGMYRKQLNPVPIL